MKRICHGNNFKCGGTKGSVNLVEKTTFYGTKPHIYSSDIKQINNHIYA